MANLPFSEKLFTFSCIFFYTAIEFVQLPLLTLPFPLSYDIPAFEQNIHSSDYIDCITGILKQQYKQNKITLCSRHNLRLLRVRLLGLNNRQSRRLKCFWLILHTRTKWSMNVVCECTQGQGSTLYVA